MQKRNYTLDLVKLIASYFVVLIHVPFSGEFGRVVMGIACFAVPLFFVVSGYFCYQCDSVSVWRKAKKITIIFLWASLLYNTMNVVLAAQSYGIAGICETLSVFCELSRWKDFLLFNLPFSATRLWFLLALIYVYIVQIIMIRIKAGYRAILTCSIICLVINLLLGEVFQLFNITIPAHYIRNFFLTGYPFFGIGLYIKHKEQLFLRLGSKQLVGLMTAGVILTFVSVLLSVDATLYFGSILITLPIFILALKKNSINYSDQQTRLFNCNLGIYIFHLPITTAFLILASVLKIAQDNSLFKNIFPLVICLATTIFTLVFNHALNVFRKKLKVFRK